MKQATLSRVTTICLGLAAFFLIAACAQNSIKKTGSQKMKESNEKKNEKVEKNMSSEDTGPEALFRINCGAEETMTMNGQEWLADQEKTENNKWGAKKGHIEDRGDVDIKNTDLDKVYRLERFDVQEYTFRVPEGSYTVKLHFAENFPPFKYPGARYFDVSIEGENRLQNFDIYKEAGGFQTAIVKTYKGLAVNDGTLNINFSAPGQTSLINGIEIIKE